MKRSVVKAEALKIIRAKRMSTKKELMKTIEDQNQIIEDLERKVKHLEKGIDVMLMVDESRRERKEFLEELRKSKGDGE